MQQRGGQRAADSRLPTLHAGPCLAVFALQPMTLADHNAASCPRQQAGPAHTLRGDLCHNTRADTTMSWHYDNCTPRFRPPPRQNCCVLAWTQSAHNAMFTTLSYWTRSVGQCIIPGPRSTFLANRSALTCTRCHAAIPGRYAGHPHPLKSIKNVQAVSLALLAQRRRTLAHILTKCSRVVMVMSDVPFGGLVTCVGSPPHPARSGGCRHTTLVPAAAACLELVS